MSHATFERLSAAGRAAVVAGTHQVEVPPFDGGPRWGCSMILRPDAGTGVALDDLTSAALAIAGDSHWATASSGCAHLTIRGLEPYRVPLHGEDPAVGRYGTALRAAARNHRALRFELGGLLLTPISVMLRARPCDDGAAGLWRVVADELGDDGWYEADYQRDIWYLNLIHFAGPIARAEELDRWVQDRACVPVEEISIDGAELVRWKFDGHRMVPSVLAAAPFTG